MKEPIEKFYSEKNRETTALIDEFLLKNFSQDSEILSHIKRRKETAVTKIKSFFVRLGFEIGNESKENWEKTVPLCALVELLNIGNYIIERDLDEENQDKSQIGYRIREQVLKSKFLDSDEKEIFKLMIQGIDKYLKIDNEILLWNKSFDYKKFLEIYERKCFLVGGQFYKHCIELGYNKSKNKSNIIKEHLLNIGKIFGTAYQMTHEVADFLPEKLKRFPEDFKYYQNQYNSLRKRKLTLPIYFALFEWKKFNKKLFLKLVEEKKYDLITEMLLKAKIIKKSKTFIRNYVKPLRKEFNYLPKNIWVDCLKFGVNAVNSNIFWKYFKKLYAEVA